MLNSPKSGSAFSQRLAGDETSVSDVDGGKNTDKEKDSDSSKDSVKFAVAELEADKDIAYMNGYPDDTIKPDKLLSREEAAAMWVRLMTDESKDAFATEENIYKDISKKNWSYKDILLLSNAGMVEGYKGGKFKPYDPVTRAEFVVIGVRFALSHEKMPEGESNQFFDVSGHWAADYINYASQKGWLTGYEDGTFRPDIYITRAESAAYINRILSSVSGSEYKKWSDNDTSAWYYDDIQKATN